MIYRESQRMRMLWVRVLVTAIAAGAWIVFGGSLLFGAEIDGGPPTWLAAILLALLGIGLPWLLLTFRLEIEVDANELRFRMPPFLSRRVPRANIASAEPVRYHPIGDYLGWGIKWMPGKGWAFTVQGNRGVRVNLKSGRTFLLGSERPDELAAALAV